MRKIVGSIVVGADAFAWPTLKRIAHCGSVLNVAPGPMNGGERVFAQPVKCVFTKHERTMQASVHSMKQLRRVEKAWNALGWNMAMGS